MPGKVTMAKFKPSSPSEPLTPVLFRVAYGDEPAGMAAKLTAIFICEPATLAGDTMTCYAQIGQHGACSWDWVRSKTRAATPAEYADLKRELESPPFGYRLRVFKYRTRPHKFAFDAELNRLRGR